VIRLQKSSIKLIEKLNYVDLDLFNQIKSATSKRAEYSIHNNGKRCMSFRRDYKLISAEALAWMKYRYTKWFNHTSTIQNHISMHCNLESLLAVLPPEFIVPTASIQLLPTVLEQDISDFILDLGKRPYFRKKSTEKIFMNKDSLVIVTKEQLAQILNLLNNGFGKDNRAGIDGQLHRINKQLKIEMTM
jgi:hypothetical protein